MNRAAFGSLWLFVFVIPWEEVARFPYAGSLGRVVGLAACLVGVLYVLIRGRVRPLGWCHVFVLLFVLWGAVGLAWSVDLTASGQRIGTYAQLGLFAWLIWELAWSRDRQLALLQAYVLGAWVLASSTIYNRLTNESFFRDDARFVALGYNPNDLALTLVLGLPLAWYLAVSGQRTRLAWLNWLYLPLGITAVLLTASRGAFLATTPALLIVPWTLSRLRLRTRVALAVVALACLVSVSSAVPEESWRRLASTRTDIEDGYLGGRGSIWKAGVALFVQHPLAGVGAGTFATAVEPLTHRPEASHQTFLSVLVEQGVIGFALFVGILVSAFLPVRRFPAPERKLWIVMLLTLCVGLMPANWDYRKPLWFLVGVLAAWAATGSGSRSMARAAPQLAAGASPKADGREVER